MNLKWKEERNKNEETKINIHRFLGISGQTFENIEKYMLITDKLKLAEQTLNW